MNLREVGWNKGNLFCWVVLAGIAAGGNPAVAVSPEVWRVSSFSDFTAGESDKVAVINPGEIRLAPSYQLYSKTGESAVWSLTESRDGNTLYAGTGNRARIYKIPCETDSATATAELFADLEGSAVYALVEGKDGFLYAGVSPGGNVYKIAPDGAVTLVGDSKEKYIWAMTFDPDGNLVLATGDSGNLVRMTLQGEVEKLLETKEKHILSLVRDEEGNLYFGTAPNGWVCTFDVNKDFRVLYDSPLSEVKAVALDKDGNLYAGVVPAVKISVKPDNPQAALAAAGAKPKSDKNSELVRISPDGLAVSLLKTDNAAVNSLFPNGEGLLLGTGDKGLLFRLGYRDNLDRLADLEPTDILVMISRKRGGLWISTANPGAVYLFPRETESGVFASKPLDAGVSSEWGAMTWVAEVPEGATLDFQTRSGNTEKPDENWSDWSEPLTEPGCVTSPPARFLQWRARFGGDGHGVSAVVHKVEIVYQKINQPPRIRALKVGNHTSTSSGGGAKGSATGKGSSSSTSRSGSNSSSGSKKKKSETLPISWKAADANGDKLVYDLHYRRVGETLWKKIKENITNTSYSWSLRNLPDGEYEIRVTASDRVSNPPRLAGKDVWISEPFRIDATPPIFGEWTNRKMERSSLDVEIQITDKTSRIVFVERVVDGDEEKVQPLLPEDGILDSGSERFHIRLEDLEPGEHSLSVRAEDEMGNVGAESLLFEVQ